jgi:hypothetical protein
MGLSVTTIARNRRLTTVDRVKSVTALDVTPDYIDRATDAIERFCNRPFAREVYSEALPGFGDIHLMLRRTPVVNVASVLFNSQVITDYSIAEPERGLLYRRAGWGWTVQSFDGLGAGGRFFDVGQPLPQQEEPAFTVAYTAGYFVPDDDIGGTTVSAANADNSFNDSASGFPALLKAGDVIETQGFANAANNGRFRVTGTPTTAKIVVDATLTTEAAGLDVTVSVKSLPGDVEQAAIETIKTWFLKRSADAEIVEKQMGPAMIRYERGASVSEFTGTVVGSSLPPLAAALLRRWVRAA